MWDVKIKVLNIAAKRVQISATRIDDISGEIWTYSCQAIIETATQRAIVLDQIKDRYLEHLNHLDQSDSVIAGLEDTAINALNTWEETL